MIEHVIEVTVDPDPMGGGDDGPEDAGRATIKTPAPPPPGKADLGKLLDVPPRARALPRVDPRVEPEGRVEVTSLDRRR